MKGSNYPYIALVKQFLANRKIFGFLVLFFILTAFAAPSPAEANWIADGFKAAGGALISLSLAAVLWALNWVGVALLLLATTVLQGVMSFVLQASYTPLSAGPDSSITIAWGVIRDFTNMLFVLILIAIGVGTMLMNFKLPITGSQQIGPGLLVKFFIVALLINFTPVITGIVIDISNILTKFFFDAAAGGANAFINENPFTNSAGDWNNDIFDLSVAAGNVIQYSVSFIFNLIASLILFTISFLLAIRVLALWLLVIFSPLAFAASILPQTSKMFGEWWGHFLQWAILPIPVGLFLWIAALMLTTQGACQINNVGTGGSSGYDVPVNNVLQGRDGGAFCKTIMSTMALGTVVAGMFASFSISAKGSGLVVSQAQKIQQGTQKWAGRRARQTTKEIGLRAGARPLAAAGRVAQRVQLDPKLSQRLSNKITGTGVGSKIVRGGIRGMLGTVEGASLGFYDKTLGGGIRGAGTAAQGPLSQYRKLWEDAQKNISGKDFDQFKNILKGGHKYEDFAATMNEALKDGNRNDLQEMLNKNEVDVRQLNDFLRESNKRKDGASKEYLKSNLPANIVINPTFNIKNEVSQMPASDVRKQMYQTWTNPEAVRGLATNDELKPKDLASILTMVQENGGAAELINFNLAFNDEIDQLLPAGTAKTLAGRIAAMSAPTSPSYLQNIAKAMNDPVLRGSGILN